MMEDRHGGLGDELVINASVGRHLALAPVAFAVTEGPSHALLYSNSLFRNLQLAGQIRIGAGPDPERDAKKAGLAPILDDVLRAGETVRDAVLAAPAGAFRDGVAAYGAL